MDGSRCCEDWWICLKSVCFKCFFFGGGDVLYMFYLHYFSIGALYQPSLSTFTVFGQGPHYIEILHLSADWRGWQSDIDIPRPPGRVRKAEHRS